MHFDARVLGAADAFLGVSGCIARNVENWCRSRPRGSCAVRGGREKSWSFSTQRPGWAICSQRVCTIADFEGVLAVE